MSGDVAEDVAAAVGVACGEFGCLLVAVSAEGGHGGVVQGDGASAGFGLGWALHDDAADPLGL